MSFELPLNSMSGAEKVRVLESVWDSLCSHRGEVSSAEWHREVLEARKQRLDDGTATVSPWGEAKARLLQVGQ